MLLTAHYLPTTYKLLPTAAYHKVYKKPGRVDAKSLPDAWRRQREIEAEAEAGAGAGAEAEAEAGAEVLGVAAELLTALAPP